MLLLVTGEAGIGKSRLVDEFARSLHGIEVPRARAYEAAGRLPWGPVIEWLRSEPVRADLDRLAPSWRSTLEVLLPELRTGPGQPARAAEPGRSEVDPDRTQLFEAIAHTLVPAGRTRLLLIDDLQWCDTDTVELVGYLVARRPEAQLLVLGTVRSDEVTEDHPLTRLVTGLGRTGSVTELPLAPLDAAATAELAQRLTGEDLTATDAERLWRDTEGNPLFLVEAARAGLATDGRGAPLTPTIKATIASRLSHLGSDARELAELAAVIGREFSTELVAAASHLDESQVLDALDELWSRRIVTERGAAYDFTHDKVREVVHDGVSPVRRRRHHRAVAAALTAAAGDDPGPTSGVVAAHLEAAGQVAEAVAAYLRAAQHASAVVGLDEAIASCNRGLALLDQLPPGPERDRQELELRLVLGGPISSREGYGSPASVAVFDRALTLSRRLGRRADPVILRGLGLAAVTACRFDRSRSFGQELVELADDPISVTEGHYLLGVTAFWRARLEESDRELRLALDSYDPERGPIHRAYFAQDPKAVCTARLALTSLWRDDVDAARRLAAEAREYAESLDHPMTLGYVLVYTAMAATELDDREWLRRDAADETSLGGHGFGFLLVVEGLYDSWLRVLEGHDGSIAELEKAVANCRLEHQSLHLTYALSLLARAYRRDGAIDAGLAAVQEGVEWGHAHDQRYAESLLCRIEGELHESRGDRPAAERAYRQASRLAQQHGSRRFHRLAEDRLRQLGTTA